MGRLVRRSSSNRMCGLLLAGLGAILPACGRSNPGGLLDKSPADAAVGDARAEAGPHVEEPREDFEPCGVAGQGDIQSLAYSPDGSLLAVGRGAGWVELRDSGSGLLLRTLPGEGLVAVSLSFSRDGGLLAESAADPPRSLSPGSPSVKSERLRLWRVYDGELVRELTPASVALRSGVISADGTEVAIAPNTSSIEIHRVSDGDLVRSISLPSPLVAVALSPDWTQIATLAGDFSIELFRVSDAGLVRSLRGSRSAFDNPTWLSFSPGSGALIAAGSQQAIEVMRTDGGMPIIRRSASAVALGSDGVTAVFGFALSSRPGVEILRTDTGETAFLPEATDPVAALTLSASGESLATGGPGNALEIWNVEARASVQRQAPTAHTALVWAAVASPDGKVVATSGADNTVRIFSPGDPPIELRTINPPGPTHSLALSPDGALLAGGVQLSLGVGAIVLWRVSDAMELRRIPFGPAAADALSFSPDGALLAGPGLGTTARSPLALWRASDGFLLRSMDTAPLRCCDTIAFSPDGALVAVGAIPNASGARVYRVDDGVEVHRLAVGSDTPYWGRVYTAAFSPDGRWLVTGTDQGPPEIWSLDDGTRLRAADAQVGTALAATVLSDGQRVATADGSDIVLWAPSDGAIRARITGHTSYVTSLASSSDGRLLVSAGGDETLRFWCR